MKERTILVKGKPFTYNDEGDEMSYDTISPISVDDAKKLLLKTKELFDKCGIRFCLTFGTLLGAVRDGTIIPGDEDVDVFVESEADLWNNIPFLYENGLRVCRIVEKYVYSFHVDNKSYIDVYFKTKLPLSIWSLWCDSLVCRAVPRKYINKYAEINFLGINCLVPYKPERLLEFWYGKSWRIPVKGHIYTYEMPSRFWWKTKGKANFLRYLSYIKLLITNPYSFICRLFKKLKRTLAGNIIKK